MAQLPNDEQTESWLETLGDYDIPMRMTIAHLNFIDVINLASTSQTMRTIVMQRSKSLQSIEKYGCFNLDLFHEIPITKTEIDTIYRIFPELRHLRIDLTFADNHLLDNIRKFKKLEKISVYLRSCDTNENKIGANIRSVTIRSKYYTSVSKTN